MPEKILVVDDDEEFANLLGLLLTKRGFKPEVAYGGVQALEMAKKLSPSIILQDYMLPDFKGMDLLKALRRDCPASSVIIITARGSEEVAVELMKAGAADYLKKPFEVDSLLLTIENVRKMRGYEAERDRLNEDLRQQNRELMALNAFSTALTSGMLSAEKCESALGIVVKNMRVDLVNIFVSANGRGLRMLGSAGPDREKFSECVIARDEGLASYVTEIRKVAVVTDFRKETRFKVPTLVFEHGITSALAAPLMYKDRALGALVAYSIEPRTFHSSDMKLMGSFAGQIAMSLESELISERLEKMRRRWQVTFDAVPDAVIVQDANHVILKANRAASVMAGMEVKDIIGQKCSWVFHNSKEPVPGCPVNDAIATKKEIFRELSTGDGSTKLAIWAYPILDDAGELEAVVEYIRKAGA
ncbi:MAG: response regulator [Nitrospirae bacterium]|nr:response regulator [Nitrospirota bacterium]MBI5695320.1 response regulator [Nitrospirota bacterium]